MSMKEFIYQFVNTVWSYIRVVRFSKKSKMLFPQTKNEEIILLGNGPSFKETLLEHMEYLKSHDTFAVNHFCKQEDYKEIEPTNYIILDSKIFLKDVEESFRVAKKELFNALIDNTTWDMNLFIPAVTDIKDEFEQLMKENSHIKVHYFNFTTLEGFPSLIYPLYDKGLGMPFAGNVMVSAIMLSMQMGYKKIKLVGADHSFHLVTTVNDDNHLCARESHFYKEKIVDAPLYSDVKKEKQLLVHEYFKHTYMQFQSYHQLQAYSQYKDVEVINASVLSYIDAFKREKLNRKGSHDV